jgi:hypothetical protein
MVQRLLELMAVLVALEAEAAVLYLMVLVELQVLAVMVLYSFTTKKEQNA